MSHLGSTNFDNLQCVWGALIGGQPVPTALYGEVSFVAANGDELWVTYDGAIVPIDQTRIAFRGTMTFIGGAGRLRGRHRRGTLFRRVLLSVYRTRVHRPRRPDFVGRVLEALSEAPAKNEATSVGARGARPGQGARNAHAGCHVHLTEQRGHGGTHRRPHWSPSVIAGAWTRVACVGARQQLGGPRPADRNSAAAKRSARASSASRPGSRFETDRDVDVTAARPGASDIHADRCPSR